MAASLGGIGNDSSSPHLAQQRYHSTPSWSLRKRNGAKPKQKSLEPDAAYQYRLTQLVLTYTIAAPK
jgi:hypothetical protein